jgi:hypothetical protein
MNKLSTSLALVLVLALSVANCAKEEEKAEEIATEEATTGGNSSAGIKAYEDFVTKFCALTAKMKTASATESVQLAKDFANDAATLKTMTADIEKIKSSSDDAQKARIDAANKKGSDCASSAASAKISAPDVKKVIPKEIPKEIPKKIPGM